LQQSCSGRFCSSDSTFGSAASRTSSAASRARTGRARWLAEAKGSPGKKGGSPCRPACSRRPSRELTRSTVKTCKFPRIPLERGTLNGLTFFVAPSRETACKSEVYAAGAGRSSYLVAFLAKPAVMRSLYSATPPRCGDGFGHWLTRFVGSATETSARRAPQPTTRPVRRTLVGALLVEEVDVAL